MKCWIIGYDPGGKDAHGVAALEVHDETGRWTPDQLMLEQRSTVGQVTKWFEQVCADGRVVAAGIDTLTEWNDGSSGWRPADLWLRKSCKEVQNSVISPNYISGAMSLNGALLLHSLAARFRQDDTMVTEVHPKVCYFALTGNKANWTEHTSRTQMAHWLLEELSVPPPIEGFGRSDHKFDATMATLAALRGVNGEWTLDLHAQVDDNCGKRALPFGLTHYWWPGKSQETGTTQ